MPVIGRMERSGTMHGGEQFNVKFDGNDFNARLDDATSVIINSRAGKLAQQVHPVADDVLAKTAERHHSMSDALKIALAGHEPGHIEFNEKGKLTQIAERETLTGGYELAAASSCRMQNAKTSRRWLRNRRSDRQSMTS